MLPENNLGRIIAEFAEEYDNRLHSRPKLLTPIEYDQNVLREVLVTEGAKERDVTRDWFIDINWDRDEDSFWNETYRHIVGGSDEKMWGDVRRWFPQFLETAPPPEFTKSFTSEG
jgi:hypothetical protein